MKREQSVIAVPQSGSARVNGCRGEAETPTGYTGTEQYRALQRLSILKVAWRGWLRFAELLGTIQMMVVLSLIYWTVLPLVAIPFRFFADPLALRRRGFPSWVERDVGSQSLDSMKNQY